VSDKTTKENVELWFGKEGDWFAEEKQAFALLETDLFNGITQAKHWTSIQIPRELADKWEDEYQTRFPHWSDTAFFTTMIYRGLESLKK